LSSEHQSSTAATTLGNPPTARRIYLSAPLSDDAAQESLEREFFSSICLQNGTYKYTYSNRLDDLNSMVARWLPPSRPLKLMDVAISSGISTLEWMKSLELAGIEHEMTAGDLTLDAYLVSLNQDLHVLVDKTGFPLQYEIKGKALTTPVGRKRRALYVFPLRQINKTLQAKFEMLREKCKNGVAQAQPGHDVQCRRVDLVSPRLRRPTNLKLIEDDILRDDYRGPRVHVLRAANILNRAYFTDDVLKQMLSQLRSRLLDDGLLVVCRTNISGNNNGSIFALREGNKFELVDRIGEGSEVEQLVVSDEL
jgi:hypothetical protein